jgi:uncharacterized protein (DUF952 family)
LTKLFHIAESTDWNAALKQGTYKPAGYDTDGFIHFSTREQVSATAERYYSGRRDLLLLEVEETDVQDYLRFEASPSGELFPHVYRTLSVTMVRAIRPLILWPDGVFSWPVNPDEMDRDL